MARDEIHGGAGGDVIEGNGGDDIISGGDGDDHIHGDTGLLFNPNEMSRTEYDAIALTHIGNE